MTIDIFKFNYMQKLQNKCEFYNILWGWRWHTFFLSMDKLFIFLVSNMIFMIEQKLDK